VIIIETSRGKRIHLIATENDLKNSISQGQWTRARCPIHGGDHQRSLSIHKTSGWGSCFQCHARVLLEDYNPQVAQELRQKYGQKLPHDHTSKTQHPREEPTSGKHRSLAGRQEERQTGERWQQEEVRVLHLLHPWMQQALKSIEIGDGWQAQAYLTQRAIPLNIALGLGVGYLPRELLLHHPTFQPFQHLLNRWTERIIFPLRSPTGNGYIGRTLWRWQVGMNEDEHTALLNDEPDAPRRYIKTNPAGWFCAPPLEWSDCLVLVEGPFDRLALLAAGMKNKEVQAIVGTAFSTHWIQDHMQAVIFAFDHDPSGIAAMERHAEELRLTKDLLVETVLPAEKDWSTQWTRYGYPGVSVLIETFERLNNFFHPAPAEDHQG
jgi:DNA primase